MCLFGRQAMTHKREIWSFFKAQKAKNVERPSEISNQVLIRKEWSAYRNVS